MTASTCVLMLLLADGSYDQSIDGVNVKLLAVSDGAGHVWSADGKPLGPIARAWNPQRNPPKFPRGPHKNTCFLIEVSADDVRDVHIGVTLSGAPMVSRGSANVPRRTPTIKNRESYLEICGVFPQAMKTTTLEVLVGTGRWRDEGSVGADGNSSYSGVLLDGGRHADFLMRTPDEGKEVKRIAVVSLVMRENDDIAEDYRIIAVDADGEIVAKSPNQNASNGHMLMMVECPAKEGVADPVKYVFQQRPKNALGFGELRLAPSSE